MPILRYWDTTQGAYVAIPGPPGQAYAAVQATAPPSTNPTVAPPNGLLWVDTGTPASLTYGAAYYPPQTPPVSGTNFFTDSSGEIWISRNGSAWARARDVLWAKVYRTTVIAASPGARWPHDGTVSDTYAMWQGAGNPIFLLPVGGVYWVSFQTQVTCTAAGQWTASVCRLNTVEQSRTYAHSGLAGALIALTTTIFKANAGDNVDHLFDGTALNTGSGAASCFAVLQYLHP